MDGSHQLADETARRAAERAEALTPKAQRRRFVANIGAGFVRAGVLIGVASVWTWRNMPGAMRALMLFVSSCFALGFLCTITAWELNNSGKGWTLIFAEWGIFAWFGGVAIAGWCMWAHRQHKEQSRAAALFKLEGDEPRKKKAEARSRTWFLSTVLCGVVTLFGVFSNLVSGAAMGMDHAIEVEEDRGAVRNTIKRLERELAALPKPSGVQFTRDTLASYISEAAGWKMANLDNEKPEKWDDKALGAYPGPGCVADLRTRQRDLCNLASGIRAELAEADEMQVGVDAKIGEIKDANTKLAALAPVSGAKHYQRMAELLNTIPGVSSGAANADGTPSGMITAEMIQTWGLFLISVFGLFVAAIGWDSIGEKVDDRKRPAKVETATATGA